MNGIEHLKEAYEGLDKSWIDKNRFVIESAVLHGCALAGSIAMSVGSKKAKKMPSDLDFVCPSVNDAMALISALQVKLMQYKSHWRVYANHKTDFVPPGCLTHFRVQTAFWLPICIMVIPVEKYRFWYSHGLRVQLFDLVKKSAQDLEVVDEKDRTSFFDEEPELESLEQALEEGSLGDFLDEIEVEYVEPKEIPRAEIVPFDAFTLPEQPKTYFKS